VSQQSPSNPAAALLPDALRERLDRAAESEATVLLLGETGTGKGTAVRYLHGHSSRSEGPLVEVSLAALAPSLIEAELFGHEKGAYTGAQGRRSGRFERAQGGTIVLDGAESLPLDVQVKLLRVLQEREVEPLGSEAPLPLDLRVIATAGADLASRVKAGEFREDLYYRLAVLELELPPLRERRSEMPRLIEIIAKHVAGRLGVPARSIEGAAQACLTAHDWPGNLRELENCLERLHIFSFSGSAASAGSADAPGKPVEVQELAALVSEAEGVETDLARRVLALGLDLETFTATLIEEAVRQESGNRSAAARRLGLSRRALDHRRRARDPESPE